MTTGLGTVLISEGEIRRRIAEIGRQISKDYAGRSLTLVGILKGSFMFLADVIRAISLETPVEVDFMSVSSYGDATTTSWTRVSRCFTSTTFFQPGEHGAFAWPHCWKNRASPDTIGRWTTSDSRSPTNSLSDSASIMRNAIATSPIFAC